MASYTPTAPKSDTAEPAPSGWFGPFHQRFVRSHPKDIDGVIVEAGKRVNTKFDTLQAAIEAADKLGDSCTAITRSKQGKFTLRAGKDLNQYTRIYYSETSYARCARRTMLQALSSADDEPAPAPTPAPIQPQDLNTKLFGSESDDNSEPEPEPDNGAIAEDEHDDEEDDEVEVEEFSVEDGAPDDGKTYYIDNKTNKIYNEDSDHIANFVDGTFTEI